MNWRVLVVEDNADLARQIKEAGENGTWGHDGDEVAVETCTAFAEALAILQEKRFDVVILDLRDDKVAIAVDEEKLPGIELFNQIRGLRFLPVIFYTALPDKVREKISPFIRVVQKTDGVAGIKTEFLAVLKTNLPALTRHLENEQREYMWDFIDQHWRDFANSHHDHVDLTYLLGRRLAFSLRGPVIRKFAEAIGGAAPKQHDKVHPMEIYVKPPVGEMRLAGDILQNKTDETKWSIVLTPSCDFSQNKAESVLLAKCIPLTQLDEYVKWAAGESAGNLEKLTKLIGDNRSGQQDRFKFLPGTFFLPDLVVDLQQLESVPVDKLTEFEAIASLDSPYAESMLAKFSRYYGRLGTPDIDREIVLGRLRTKLAAAPAAQ